MVPTAGLAEEGHVRKNLRPEWPKEPEGWSQETRHPEESRGVLTRETAREGWPTQGTHLSEKMQSSSAQVGA